MALKFVVLCATLAVAKAGFLGAPALGYAAAPAVAYSAAPAVSSIAYSSPVVSYGAPLAAGAITSQQSNILRSFGNLGQVSTYSKTIDTPFSSVTKSDVRVSNPGVRTVAYGAAPAIAYGAAPAIAYGAAPALGYAAPAVSYAAPAIAAAPAVAYSAAPAVSNIAYSSPVVSYGGPLAAGAITSQQSNILRSFGNLGQVSTYSKTIDTPFSSVSKSDVRVSNPGVRTVAYGAAPALAYGAGLAYGGAYGLGARAITAAPLGVTYSAAPAVAHVSYAGNIGSYAW